MEEGKNGGGASRGGGGFGRFNSVKGMIASTVADSRLSRFMSQRSSEVGVPRRRSSVTHGQPSSVQSDQQKSTGSKPHIMSAEIEIGDVSAAPNGLAAPAKGERRNTTKERSTNRSAKPPATIALEFSFDFHCFFFVPHSSKFLGVDGPKTGGSLRAHLRDSLRLPRTLQSHLSRETLPKIDNYHSQVPGGAARPTLDELYYGESPVDKVPFLLRFLFLFFYLFASILDFWAGS